MIAAIIISSVALAFLGLYVFLICASSHKGMEKYSSVKYAHRGLHGNFSGSYSAENSLSAFGKAAELGFGIELDVRLSRDGEVVVFHDDTLDRVAGVSGKAEEFTTKELSAMSLKGTDEGVPTFKEVLSVVSGRVPLLVEIKSGGTDQEVTRKTYEILKSYTGPYIIESFNPLSLKEYRRLDKRALRGFLCEKLTLDESRRTLKYRVIQRHLLNFLARPNFIAANKKRIGMFPIPLIRLISRPPMFAWTIKSPEEEREAYQNGFNTVIFEGYIPEKTKAEKKK